MRNIIVPNDSFRHEWVEQCLKQINKKNAKLLDAGCGTQRYRNLCDGFQYYAQDFGEYIADGEGLQAKNFSYGKLNYVGNIWEIDEEDNFFDVILCTEVLEHIPYPNETIAEFARLLKTGGTLILTAPYSSLPHMQPYYFYSGFSLEWYKFILDKYQFQITEITPNGNFYSFILQEELRSVAMIKNPLVKLLYGLATAPKILSDLILSRYSNNHQLLFGYQVVAVKK